MRKNILRRYCLVIMSIGICFFCEPTLGKESISKHFAKNVVKEQEQQRFDYWNGTEEQPGGGVVVRYQFDVSGDGIDDWIYKSSISSKDYYTVYVSEKGAAFPNSGELYLNHEFYVRDEKNGRVMTSIFTTADFLSIVESRSGKDGSFSVKTLPRVEGYKEVMSFKSTEGWPESSFGGKSELENGQVCSLQNLLINEGENEVLWVEFAKGRSLRSAYQYPDIREKLFVEKEFTPQEAMELVHGEKRVAGDIEKKPKQHTQKRILGATEGISKEITSSSEKKLSGVWLILGGVVISIAYFILRKKNG